MRIPAEKASGWEKVCSERSWTEHAVRRRLLEQGHRRRVPGKPELVFPVRARPGGGEHAGRGVVVVPNLGVARRLAGDGSAGVPEKPTRRARPGGEQGTGVEGRREGFSAMSKPGMAGEQPHLVG